MEKKQTQYYKKFCGDMILRDYLALDRTVLANKRTLLAYVRTFIGLITGGIGMVKLLDELIVNVIGYVFIFAALPILIIGIIEYVKMARAVQVIDKNKNEHL